jgi:hypothetical protein
MEPIKGRSIVNLSVIPDLDDPNNYCKSCKKSSSTKTNYRTYLKNLHNLTTKKRPAKNPNIIPDKSYPNTHRASCNFNCSSRQVYTRHLKNIHNMIADVLTRNRKTKVDHNIQPVVNDSNDYCNSCKTYLS